MSEETFRWIVTGGVAIATLCILVQAIVMFVLLRVVMGLKTKAEPLIELAKPIIPKVEGIVDQVKPIVAKVDDLVGKAQPIVVHGGEILADAKPKISRIASDAVDIVNTGKQQVQDVSVFMKDFLGRAKSKVEKVDEAVDDTVEQVQHAGKAVKQTVLRPVRGVEGLVAGIRAGVATYAAGRRPTVDNVTQDEEMFI